MSEAKFTKGEWEILPIEDDREYIRIRGTALGFRYKIANVDDIKNHHNVSSNWCKRDREEAMANAHLIKTAPKLYKFIESLQLDVSKEIEAEQLLAKARGEYE